MSPDSVVIQVALVQMPADSDRVDEEIWREIDEQLLPLEVRRRLARNGFRCGLIGDQIPNAIRELLDQQQAESTLAGPTPKLPQHRIHCGAGHRNEIVASGRREEVVVLHQTQGSLSGTTYRDARCVLATRCFPAGDGGARIEITPEIDHGPVRQKWVPGDGTFRLEAGHERHSFTELTMDTKLIPGQSLILTCTPERVGVGRNFFVEDKDGVLQQRLVLIRLAQFSN